MNKTTIKLILAISIIITIGSASSAIKANRQKKLAEAEIEGLNQVIAKLNDRPARQRGGKSDPAAKDQAETKDSLTTLKDAAPVNTPEAPVERERPQRESFEERMARMKEEKPEEYATYVQRMEERQAEMKYTVANRTATIMDVNTELMTTEELETHEKLVSQMAGVWELMEQMKSPEEGSNRELMRELYDQSREIRPLLEQERTAIFRIMGNEMGFEGKAAEEFATHIEDVISATSIQMPRGGGRGGR